MIPGQRVRYLWGDRQTGTLSKLVQGTTDLWWVNWDGSKHNPGQAYEENMELLNAAEVQP